MSRLAIADLLLRDAAALLIVKATVVLALTSSAAALAKGFSAARRHLLWLAGLSSCLWLVLSSPILPAIMIHTPALVQSVAAAHPAAAASSSRSPIVVNTSRSEQRFFAATSVVSPRSIQLPRHPLVALWVIGFVALLVRHAIGLVGATGLARRAFIGRDDESSRELAGVATVLGVSREVHLGYSAEVESPITFGIAKAFVLLPTEARSWSIERRRAVLVHEAAHIARADWLSQTIGRVACELFWFHPLAWHAFARLRDEAERAADDCVLRAGMPAFEYGTHLLELARRAANSRHEVVAVGMVSGSELERRLRALFDANRSRASLTSRARAITTSVALALVCPLASLRVAAPALRMDEPRRQVERRQPAAVALHVPRMPAMRAPIVVRSAPEMSHSSIALDQKPIPAPVAHPDFSGKWTSDTVAYPPETTDFFVTDSLIIRQSEDSIALDGRGHVLDTPTHNRFHNITFDGAELTGVAISGTSAMNVVLRAVWVRDTLVLTSDALTPSNRVHAGAHLHTVERMTLSADGNTLSTSNLSFVDGNMRWGGPRTFVLRRLTQ